MTFIDYYEVLQVSPKASLEIIKSSYKQLSRMYHPDVSSYDSNKFILIKDAYDVLSDVNKRCEYDAIWRYNKVQYKNDMAGIFTAEKPEPEKNSKQISETTRMPIVYAVLISIILFTLSQYTKDTQQTQETYNNSQNVHLTSYDIEKIKTNDCITNGDAYFTVYNGSDFVLEQLTFEIKIKNDSGDIVDTRKFVQNVNIAPYTTEDLLAISTGISGLPIVEEGTNLRIQPQYISWSYVDVVGDKVLD